MTNYKGSSQERADKKYREKVSSDEDLRKRRSKLSAFRTAKSYIRNHATLEDLAELKKLINERESNLKEKKD